MPPQTSRDQFADAAEPVAFSTGFGLTADTARATIRCLAAVAYGAGTLAEWSSADAPGVPPDLPPLYYAAWLPSGYSNDLPLGLGASHAEALADLLWALGAPTLASSLWHGDDPPPATEDTPLSAGAAH